MSAIARSVVLISCLVLASCTRTATVRMWCSQGTKTDPYCPPSTPDLDGEAAGNAIVCPKPVLATLQGGAKYFPEMRHRLLAPQLDCDDAAAGEAAVDTSAPLAADTTLAASCAADPFGYIQTKPISSATANTWTTWR